MQDPQLSIEKGHFNLMCKAIEECFLPVKRYASESDITYAFKKQKIQQRRIKFAKSRIVEVWADCSDNFDYNKIKKAIIKFNS